MRGVDWPREMKSRMWRAIVRRTKRLPRGIIGVGGPLKNVERGVFTKEFGLWSSEARKVACLWFRGEREQSKNEEATYSSIENPNITLRALILNFSDCLASSSSV